MYADPRNRYGRLTAERFFAARMTVDTGLNVLGWPSGQGSSLPAPEWLHVRA